MGNKMRTKVRIKQSYDIGSLCDQPTRHTHTHPFSGPFSRTTRVSRYQKGKTNLDFTEARDNEWQWHQLGHMQVCTSLQTNNQASTRYSVFKGRMPFLPPNQQCQSTEGITCDQHTEPICHLILYHWLPLTACIQLKITLLTLTILATQSAKLHSRLTPASLLFTTTEVRQPQHTPV